MSGRYEATFTGLPPAPSGKVYVGWFLRLLSPESTLIRTEPIFPAPDGRALLQGTTGRVKGPAIEHYYSFALSYYLLNECDKALPLIEVARCALTREDANALTTRDLMSLVHDARCGGGAVGAGRNRATWRRLRSC